MFEVGSDATAFRRVFGLISTPLLDSPEGGAIPAIILLTICHCIPPPEQWNEAVIPCHCKSTKASDTFESCEFVKETAAGSMP
jgi:hypothetical protein